MGKHACMCGLARKSQFVGRYKVAFVQCYVCACPYICMDGNMYNCVPNYFRGHQGVFRHDACPELDGNNGHVVQN